MAKYPSSIGSVPHSVGVLALVVLGLGHWGSAAAQTAKAGDVVTLDPKRCIAITTEQRRWLSPEWNPFAHFVSVCAVRRGSAPPSLFVVTIRVLDFEATLPQNAPAPGYPHPLLVLADGTRVGSLPFLFPNDPPRTLRVSFQKWRRGFPEEIKLYVDDPTVMGSRSLPTLKWDSTNRRYAVPRSTE